MIRPGALLIVIILIAAVLASARTSLTVQDDDGWLIEVEERREMARKLHRAQRVPYYRVTRERGPTFRLTGTEKKIRLISHLILRPGTEYDPRRRLGYGLRVRIRKGANIVAEFEIHTQTRQSKDREFGSMWLDENAFTRDRRMQIADDRLFPVFMPEDLPPDSTLEVRLLGNDGDEGLIRAYNEVERDDFEREAAVRSLDPIARRDQVWTNTYTPWTMLPYEERKLRMRSATERLSVIGKSGIDYEIVTIRYTGFRLPLEYIEEIGPQPLEISRYLYAAINIAGPANLQFDVKRAASQYVAPYSHPDVTGDPADDSTGNSIGDHNGENDDSSQEGTKAREAVTSSDLSVIVVPATDPARPEEAPVPVTVTDQPLAAPEPQNPPEAAAKPRPVRARLVPDKGQPGRFTLQVPPGLHSVQFGGRSPEPLQVWVSGPKNAPFGAPAEYGRSIGRLYPDYIRIPVYIAGPGWSQSVQIAGLGDVDAIGRRLKIEARFFAAPSLPQQLSRLAGRLGDLPALLTRWFALAPAGVHLPPEPTFRGTLTARFYDRDGVLIDTAQYTRSSVRAPFEWIEMASESPEPIAVAEPSDIRLIVPRGVFRIELSSSQPVVLRLFRYLPGEQLYERPYRDVELADKTRWRYVRIEERVWWPMRPLNLRQLAGGIPEHLGPAEVGHDPGSPALSPALVADYTDFRLTGSSLIDELVNPSQLGTLVAQVRVQRSGYRLELDSGGEFGDDEEDGDDDDDDIERLVTSFVIKPIGQHERHDVIEPVPPERRALYLARWPPGLLAELPTDRETAYRFSDAGYRDARVHYWLAPSDLGGEVTIEVDGQPTTFELLQTTSGFLELPTLPPGVHRLRGRSRAQSLRMYIERPVVEGSRGPPPAQAGAAPASSAIRLFRRREVYAMDRDLMPVRVYRPPGKEPRLNVVLYAPWQTSDPTTPDIQVRCLIGGGHPRRREGVPVKRFTRADRTVALPDANRDMPAQFADTGSGSAGYPRRFAVPLGDDLAIGTHVIECYSVTGIRLWARFYVTDSAAAQGERTLQWKVPSDP